MTRKSTLALLLAFSLLLAAAACGGGGGADLSAYGDEPIAIAGLSEEEFSVTPRQLAALDCVSRSATGATAKAGTVEAYGPLLDSFLAQYGKKAADYSRIRFLAGDGYRVVLRDEYLTDYEVVLSVSKGDEPLPESERPLRILIPGAESNMWEYACNRIEFVEKETQAFTDSAGRTVTLPADIRRVAPSGAYAQLFLYSLCPEKLIGLSSPFSRKQQSFIDEKYLDLPVFGQFYGKNATMNFEEIIKAAPDVIIDAGEPKAGIAADMDGIREQTGIPVIFAEATLRSMADAYDALGPVLGAEERASALSAYIRDVLRQADENNARIPEGAKKRVLFGGGEYGLNVNGAGSVHAEVLEVAGAENAAVLGRVSDSGGDEVSIEQVLLWDPDVIILAPDSNYGDIFSDPLWADVRAVKEGEVYEVPEAPYNWLDRPPSVQRALGVLWLSKLLYPELCDFDMIEETMGFYRLFWNYDLSEEEARDLLKNSLRG